MLVVAQALTYRFAMNLETPFALLGARAAGSPYGKTQEWWPPPYQ
jgi:hypothetical protein